MNLKLNDGEKKVLLFWIIIAIIIVGIFLFIEIKKNVFDKYNGNYTIVREQNRYYTVNSAINKFYSYISSNNTSNVLLVLNDEYKKKNNISENNINEYFNFNNKLVSFVPKKMYQKEIKKGVYSYYVSGYNEYVNTGLYINDDYYEVILDGNTFTFNIQKISKEMYEEISYEK